MHEGESFSGKPYKLDIVILIAQFISAEYIEPLYDIEYNTNSLATCSLIQISCYI